MDFSLKISTHSQQFSIRISLSTDESKNKNFHFLHAVPFTWYILTLLSVWKKNRLHPSKFKRACNIVDKAIVLDQSDDMKELPIKYL